MKRNLALLFRESFIPVTMVIVLIFLLLLFVQYKSAVDENKAIVIEIEHSQPVANLDGENDASDMEFTDFYVARKTSPVQEEAEKLIASGRLKDAVTIYQGEISQRKSSEIFNDLGVLYFKMGERDKALTQLNFAVNTNPVYIRAYFNRGVVLSSLNLHEQAIADYLRLLASIPSHFEAQYNLGVSYLRHGDDDNAISAFDKASSLTGGGRKARALYNKGLAYLSKDETNTASAGQAFEAAIRLKPDYLAARIGLVSIQADSPQGYADAQTELDKILSIKPNYPLAHFHKALIYNKQGQAKKSANAYLKAIQYNPEYSKARYNYGLLMLESKQWNKAREQFEWVLSRSPNHVRSIFNLGRAAYAMKDYPTALKQYYTAINLLRGNYPEAYLNIGLVHSAKKEFELGVQAYKEAIRLREAYPEAWYNLGLLYLREDLFDKAVESFQASITHDASYYQAWFNLGIIHARNDHDALAIEAYQKSIAIRANYLPAKLNLATRYAKNNQFDKAIHLYKDVLTLEVSYASAWYNLGIAYRETQSYDLAEEALRKFIELETNSMKGYRTLARVMMATENYPEAIKLLQHAIDIEPANYRLHRELAKAYEAAGFAVEAKSAANKAKILKEDQKQAVSELTNNEKDNVDETNF